MLLDPSRSTEAPPVANGHAPSAASPLEELNQQGQRIQELAEQIDALPDRAARALLHELLETTMAFQGRSLARILKVVQDAGPEGEKVLGRLTKDEAVRGLLLIHGLHPVDLAARLQEALDKVRPYMESHGGNVELLSLENDFARLRLHGACKSCPSSSVTMELAVRRAIEECCPDLAGFEVEGTAEAANGAGKPPVEHRRENAIATSL